MAIFKKDNKKKEEKALTPGKARIDQGAKGGEKLSSVILSPRITEKSSYRAADGAYTFMVATSANKVQIKQAINEIYGVMPEKVNIINRRPQAVVVRGRRGMHKGTKKALVYLKEGDKIEFV